MRQRARPSVSSAMIALSAARVLDVLFVLGQKREGDHAVVFSDGNSIEFAGPVAGRRFRPAQK